MIAFFFFSQKLIFFDACAETSMGSEVIFRFLAYLNHVSPFTNYQCFTSFKIEEQYYLLRGFRLFQLND